MNSHRRGFTLIELIAVIIIIGVLAAIAAPIMTGMKSRAICAEAAMLMGEIRSALRVYYVEHGTYPDIQDWLVNLDPADVAKLLPGLDVNGLTGTYFGKECFFVRSLPAISSITIHCYFYPPYGGGSPSTAPKAYEGKRASDSVGGLYPGVLYMQVKGNIWHDYVSRSGYPDDEPS